MASIRLAHYLAQCGVASRRQSARLIEAGRVVINSIIATHTDLVSDNQPPIIYVDGVAINAKQEVQYWLFNKPVGMDCRLLQNNPSSLVHVLPKSPRLYPAGRLDKDSHGLLLLTNDGELSHRLMHPDFKHSKEYVVKVNKAITTDFLAQMAKGVSYKGITTQPCTVWSRNAKPDETHPLNSNENEFVIRLTQGMNRQIRRMCQALGYHVVDLQRVAILDVELGLLKINKMRPLTAAEISELQRNLGLSSTPS